MPRAMLPPLLFLLAVASLAPSEVIPPPAAHNQLPDIPALIDHLADPDPSDAVSRLEALAQFARTQLIQAMDSASPEVRSQISRILLHRLWTLPTDADSAKAILSDYALQNVDGRRQTIVKLAQLPEPDAAAPILRILQNDPSPAVRWDAAEFLRANATDKSFLDQLRSLSASPAPNDELSINAPLLSVCGWAWRDVDVHRTQHLLSQAVAVDAKHPAAMNGQLDFAYAWLIELATEDQRFPDALLLLRQQAARTASDEQTVPAPIANLLALHAEFGPFPGFLHDLQTYRSYLDQPQLIHAMARLLHRQNCPALALTLDTLAILQGGFSSDAHCQTGGFLIDQGWNTQARCELQISLWLSQGNQAVNPYFQLARLAGEEGDELATAVDLESALNHASGLQMQRTTRFGEVLPWSDDDAWAEVHWHYLRAARAANDMTAVQLHLQKLLELDRLSQILQKDPNLATDIVPALNDIGKTEDAKKCFDAAYKNLKDIITADPTDPEAKNNLAWLCARCDQRLDEAVKLSQEAVTAAPANSAYLDTAAEAHFRAGDPAKAVQLETKALQLKPNDSFMTEQLKRFETALPH
jgi:tetratricopeptide (TPR) repeat protein